MAERTGRGPLDQGAEVIDEACTPLRRPQIGPGSEVVEQEPTQWHRLVEAALERVPAFGSHETVGVLALGKEQEMRPAAGLHRRQGVLHRPPCRASASLVTVEAERDVVDGAKHPLDVDLRRGGAEGCDRAVDSRLRECHHIHVALHHEQPRGSTACPPHAREPVQFSALSKDRCFRRVEVLRLPAVDDAGAESDDAAPRVVDGESDPVAEPVVGPAVIALYEQSGPDKRLAR